MYVFWQLAKQLRISSKASICWAKLVYRHKICKYGHTNNRTGAYRQVVPLILASRRANSFELHRQPGLLPGSQWDWNVNQEFVLPNKRDTFNRAHANNCITDVSILTCMPRKSTKCDLAQEITTWARLPNWPPNWRSFTMAILSASN